MQMNGLITASSYKKKKRKEKTTTKYQQIFIKAFK